MYAICSDLVIGRIDMRPGRPINVGIRVVQTGGDELPVRTSILIIGHMYHVAVADQL